MSGLVTAIGFYTRIPLKGLSTASDELAMTALARVEVGGIGGDVLGAIQQLSELAVLLLGVAVAEGAWGVLPWWRP